MGIVAWQIQLLQISAAAGTNVRACSLIPSVDLARVPDSLSCWHTHYMFKGCNMSFSCFLMHDDNAGMSRQCRSPLSGSQHPVSKSSPKHTALNHGGRAAAARDIRS